MVSSDAFWGLAGVFIGTVLSFVSALTAKRIEDRRQARGLLTAIRTDIDRCIQLFSEYRSIATGAPAYRLPVSTWSAALPFLAGIKGLTPDQIATIARLFDVATELNYYFDRIASPEQGFRSAEIERARIKVSHALDIEPPHTEPPTVRALAAADAAIARLR